MRKAVTGEFEGNVSTDANSAIRVWPCAVDRAKQNYDTEIAGKCFDIEEFQYLGRQKDVKIGLLFTYVLRSYCITRS